jgi:hypothetical protein
MVVIGRRSAHKDPKERMYVMRAICVAGSYRQIGKHYIWKHDRQRAVNLAFKMVSCSGNRYPQGIFVV